ncbi:unnamed protein product [Lactuca virosa]|uniref:Uncharacterized protein n=1 Tax=Lactuca virosa TaxID=75947 RepID=A0AAU9PBW8_9ASTR|nr:unnamed protein product [Lactuca virosa]
MWNGGVVGNLGSFLQIFRRFKSPPPPPDLKVPVSSGTGFFPNLNYHWKTSFFQIICKKTYSRPKKWGGSVLHISDLNHHLETGLNHHRKTSFFHDLKAERSIKLSNVTMVVL